MGIVRQLDLAKFPIINSSDECVLQNPNYASLRIYNVTLMMHQNNLLQNFSNKTNWSVAIDVLKNWCNVNMLIKRKDTLWLNIVARGTTP